ncbi:hypothetical protein [Methylobrevis pamukkalensis]|uniref:Lipoprotein n=1 Tax=Methylobrevis pamukkalensis TaxID=1439726 RepID=A0A1E3H1E3_9HYPH|nr:hypothetical protein [Methylobrevis pamukkalensis]ODN70148.1 hypothetical protein A6302_02528 [Methylobrevis pamukkalensis]
MRQPVAIRVLPPIVVIGAVAVLCWLMLAACGLDLFGWRVAWCGDGGSSMAAFARIHALEAEARDLETAARAAADCPAPPPAPEVVAQAAEPAPPAPAEPLPEGTELDLGEDFDLSQLAGCWKSTNSEILLVDMSGREVAKQVITFCFDADGRSGRKIVDPAGPDTCEPVAMDVLHEDGILRFRHGQMYCTGRIPSIVPGRIECRPGDAPESPAVCDMIDIINGVDEPQEGRMHGERFRRVAGP